LGRNGRNQTHENEVEEQNMTRAQRVLAYFGVLALVAVVLIAWDGVITVRVREKKPGGHRVYVAVPGILVPVALHFIPARYFHGADCAQMRVALPLTETVANSLSHVSNTILVEVNGPGTHVLVRKSGWSLVTDVSDADADVHVSVPLRALRATARALESKALDAHDAEPPAPPDSSPPPTT
jgi:hypothetical protein